MGASKATMFIKSLLNKFQSYTIAVNLMFLLHVAACTDCYFIEATHTVTS